MAAKIIKIGGRKIRIYSVKLPNGNLVIPKRMEHDRNEVDWVEVAPGSSDHKRWSFVACEEADPRTTSAYKQWKASLNLPEKNG